MASDFTLWFTLCWGCQSSHSLFWGTRCETEARGSLDPGAVGFVDMVLCSVMGQCWFVTVFFWDTITKSVNSPRLMISDYSLIPVFVILCYLTCSGLINVGSGHCCINICITEAIK